MSKNTLLDKSDWQKVAVLVEEIIDRHFAKGVSPDGVPFDQYSPEYRQELLESGESTKPDNQRTGAFRNSFSATVSDTGVQVKSTGTTGQQIGWSKANEKRPVVGLGNKEVDEVMAQVLKAVSARLKELTR